MCSRFRVQRLFMNTETQIVELALENLQKNTGITGVWKPIARKEIDGKVELKLNNKTVKINAEIKKELRGHQLQQTLALAETFHPLMVVAQNIFPKIKEELRKNGVAYLETNGNIFLNQDGNFIWLDLHKALPAKEEKVNRAFTKTGLKVLFYFLLNEGLLNLTYRDIAALADVALGNINYVITGLKEQNFLIKLDENQYKLQSKKELFEKWIIEYEKKMKPTLEIGTFRFAKADDFLNWQNLPLNTERTKWGGEPAGDLLTNYLKPKELTLYTTEEKNELIKNYRLIPDARGNVKIYQKFWRDDVANAYHKLKRYDVTPPLLVYTDLMNTNDRRCIETAEKVYERYLQDEF